MSDKYPGTGAYQDMGAARPPKQVGVAYALAIFFGIVGVHRLYLNKWKTALGFMGLAVLGIAFLIPEYFRLSWIIGAVLLGIVAIAWVYDLFTLPRQVREVNAAIAEGGATE